MNSRVFLFFVIGLLAINAAVASGSVKGQITDVEFDADVKTLTAFAKIKNTGTEGHRFWLGMSLQDEDGDWWDARGKSMYVNPGKKSGLICIIWKAPNNAPEGWYKTRLALWEDYDQANDQMINRLDKEEKSRAYYLDWDWWD